MPHSYFGDLTKLARKTLHLLPFEVLVIQNHCTWVERDVYVIICGTRISHARVHNFPPGSSFVLQNLTALEAGKLVVSRLCCLSSYTNFFVSQNKNFCQYHILIFPCIDINFQFHVTKNVLGTFLCFTERLWIKL